jgi:hypothetical protein
MADPKESNFYRDAAMTDSQIIKRFQLLFGRDMTPKERRIFLLPDNDSTLTEEEK